MRKVVIVLTVTMALVTSLQLLASTAVAEPTLYFCDVPNKDIVITNDVEKTWLFIGNIYYQSGHCTNIQTTLYVDGSPVGNWAQGGCYDNSGTIEAVHCQTLSAGIHTVRFSYTVNEGGVNSARFVGFPLPEYFCDVPNKDIVITNDVEKTWLFIGNIYYQSGHCTNIQTTLYVDGSPVGNWAQGGCYDNSGTIEAVHCQTLSAGIHTVRFSYTVNEGGVNSTRFVGFPVPLLLNKPPVADANGPYTANEGSLITFDASHSFDPNNDPLQYRWDFNNDGTWDTGWSSSPTASYTWYDDWTGTAKVEVSDGKLTDDDTASVTVNNVPPTADAGPDKTVDVFDLVAFNGTATDPGLDTFNYEWDFGDGDKASGQNVTHAYKKVGDYIVTLTVTDDDGGVGTDTAKVTVNKRRTQLVYSGDTKGQYSDSVTLKATLTDKDGGLSGKTITFTIGAQSTTATTDASGVATVSITLAQNPVNTYAVEADFAGDGYYIPSHDSDPFDIQKEDTVLVYNGDLSEQYSDTAKVSATLTDADSGLVIGDPHPGCEGETITFTISTQSTSAISGATGYAEGAIDLRQAPGSYTVETDFAGTDYYLPAHDSASFTIQKEETVLTYNGDLSGQYSDSVTLKATLAEIDTEVGDLSGKTIVFTIGSQTATATTNAAGVAQTTMALNQSAGSYTVETVFAGDAYYLPSNDSDAFEILKEDTILTYTGDISGQYSDEVTLSATLAETDSEVGNLSGKTITFTIGTQSATAATNVNGVATTTLILNQVPGSYTVETNFAGDAYYLPSGDSDGFEILKEDTVLSVPNGAIVYSDETIIQVTLYDDDGQTLFHQSDYPKVVYLEYFDGTNWTVISQGTLDSPGDSFFDVFFEIEIPANLDEIAGVYDIRARFDGDIYYNGDISGTGTLTISKEDTLLSPPNGTVTYGQELVITVTLLDNDGETLLHQADTPKTVYLEFFDGADWLILAEDSLNSVDNSDYELDLTFVCDGPVPPFDDGGYLIRVRFDGDNRYNGDITEGTLIILNAPPEANAGDDQTVDEGDSVTFDGSGSFDIDTNPTDEIPYLAYDWDFADGSGGTGVNQTHAYGDNGVYTVTLTVTDDDGAQDSDTMVVTVNNVAPSVSIDSVDQPNPHFILPHHKLTFTGSFTDPGWLDNHTDIWDFGDSTTAPGTLTEENEPPDATGTSTVKHAYSEPGTYTVTLTITDDDNGVGTSEPWTVTVLSAGQAVDVLDDYIQSLPDNAFKKPADQRKNALHEKLIEVAQLIAAEEYQEAIDKLQHDIRAKADGSVDGNPKNDWITDSAAQQEICAMIDDIIAYLQTLSAPALAPALAEVPGINGKVTKAALSLSPSYTFAAPSPYPQPCNPEVWIPYALGKGIEVTIGIYSANGKLVRVLDIGYQKAGVYISKEKAAHWDGRNEYGEQISSGVYFYTIKAGNFIATKKMVVLR